MRTRKIIDIKLGKFIFVGVINTLTGMVIMFGLYNLAGCSYWISTAANYLLTSIMSFFLNKYFTFKYSGDMAGSSIKFVVNIAACYLIAYGFAKPVVFSLIKAVPKVLQTNIAMVLGMCLFTGLNYFGQRYFVFKNNSNPD